MLDQKGVHFKLTNITKMFVRISNSMKKYEITSFFYTRVSQAWLC